MNNFTFKNVDSMMPLLFIEEKTATKIFMYQSDFGWTLPKVEGKDDFTAIFNYLKEEFSIELTMDLLFNRDEEEFLIDLNASSLNLDEKEFKKIFKCNQLCNFVTPYIFKLPHSQHIYTFKKYKDAKFVDLTDAYTLLKNETEKKILAHCVSIFHRVDTVEEELVH